MAKALQRLKARGMRYEGKSVLEIARKLRVSKSSVSYWTRDIILSERQLEKLRKNSLKGAERGRFRGALAQKKRRLRLIELSNAEGIAKLGILSEKEFFSVGVALYWAEGTKKRREVVFCNSDPSLVNFMIRWLQRGFGVKKDEFAVCVGINEIHRPREKVVRKYWSGITSIPLSQFRKTSFKKVQNKKVYKNFNTHYGTLTVKVLKPARFYYKIMGLIEGLKHAPA